MVNPISATSAYSSIQGLMSGGKCAGTITASSDGAAGAAGGDFGSLLKNVVEGVTSTGRNAETQAAAAVTGRGDLVNVVTAVAESETALQTLVAVRDRVISAYQEIMRMQI